VLTVDFRRFPVGPGDRVLDLGCGGGGTPTRAHTGAAADVVACDADLGELRTVAEWRPHARGRGGTGHGARPAGGRRWHLMRFLAARCSTG